MVRPAREKSFLGNPVYFVCDGHQRTARMFPASVAPRATMIVLPGSTETIGQFLTEFPFEMWQRLGCNVAILGSRVTTGHTWLPVTERGRDMGDVNATVGLISIVESYWGELPLWLAGHSGGACFAHTWCAVMARAFDVAPRKLSIVSNAGWVWPWCEKYINKYGPTVRVCFRVGAHDRLFNRSKRRTAFDGADAYASAGCEVRRVTVPGGRHEWLAADDEALAEWMLGSRQPALA